MQIKIVTDNQAHFPLAKCEHGLAIWLENDSESLLLDTGMTPEILSNNLRQLKLDLSKLKAVVLSHHTGGLSALPNGIPVYSAPGIEVTLFSRHADGSMHDLTMPAASKKHLQTGKQVIVASPREITDGVIITGPIPRLTDEDTGGDFFLDEDGNVPDLITDEQALILREGQILITGCGHAGIINTLLYAKSITGSFPKEIIGGLHLLHATEERLQKIKIFLLDNGIICTNLLHCTGDTARQMLPSQK